MYATRSALRIAVGGHGVIEGSRNLCFPPARFAPTCYPESPVPIEVPGVFGRAKVLQVAGMSHGRQRERLSLNRMQSLRRECGYSSHSRGTNYHQLDPMYKRLKVQILQQLRREAQSTE